MIVHQIWRNIAVEGAAVLQPVSVDGRLADVWTVRAVY